MDLSNTSHRWGVIVALGIVAAVAGFVFMKRSAQDTVAKPQVADASETAAKTPEEPRPETAAQKESTPVTGAIIKTNFGDIEIAFFRDQAPNTVLNFQKLAETGFYTSTKFHRVIKDFMIQGGDPLSKDDKEMGRWGTGGPGYTFADEINTQKIVRGALAMANAGPNTNGSQFFIVTAEATPWLDGRHTVFGKVVRGMDVVDKISLVEVMQNDIPTSPVIVLDIKLK